MHHGWTDRHTENERVFNGFFAPQSDFNFSGWDAFRSQYPDVDYPNITIRVVPFSVGMYPRLRVPYILIEFPDPEDEDVLYLENPFGELIVRENSPEEKDRVDPVNYLGIFWQLEQIAPKENAKIMIDDALSQLERAMSRPLQTSGAALLDAQQDTA